MQTKKNHDPVSRKRGLSVTEKRLEEERRAATERQPYQRRPKTPSKRPKLSKAQQADKIAAAALKYWNGTVAPALTETSLTETEALAKSLFKLVWEHAGEVEARAAVASLCEPVPQPQPEPAAPAAAKPAKAAKAAKRSTSPEVQIPFSGRWRLKSAGKLVGEFDLDGEELCLAKTYSECFLTKKMPKASDKFDLKFKGEISDWGSVTGDYWPQRPCFKVTLLVSHDQDTDTIKGKVDVKPIAGRMPYFQHKDADAAGAKFSFTGKRMDLGAYAGRMSL